MRPSVFPADTTLFHPVEGARVFPRVNELRIGNTGHSGIQ